jgi:dipeptidase D
MSANHDTVSQLEPANVWEIFAGMANVPRPSKDEARIRDHVIKLAASHNLETATDSVGNVIVTVPASPGREKAPITVIQAHLDMVCEKNRGTKHDFDKDAIRLIIGKDDKGEAIVVADGTTLGADNGIGVAMALAASISSDVQHGPLELLLTIDEEDGMTGAKGLTPEVLKGRRLLNLDSEEDDMLYIGCAGGCDTTLSWNFAQEPAGGGYIGVQVEVRGLKGGHSGGEIHENRGNAIKLLGRVLMSAPGLQLGHVDGGNKRNAIPREAAAFVAVSADGLQGLENAAEQVLRDIAIESDEPSAEILVTPCEVPGATISQDASATVLQAIAAIPHGVLGMSTAVPGLVQTSNNLATAKVKWDGDCRVQLGTLSRSSLDSRISETSKQIAGIGRLAGATVSTANEYPGWEPDVDSEALATTRRIYEKLFGETPDVTAIHAGLECGIIQERIGKMDMVSFGPRIEGPHSPDERVYIDSVAKSWKLLGAVLDALSA